MMDFTSGYVLRALEQMPRQGSAKPWKLYQNYILDRLSLGRGAVVDDCIVFESVSTTVIEEARSTNTTTLKAA
jgi:hypothetical protein